MPEPNHRQDLVARSRRLLQRQHRHSGKATTARLRHTPARHASHPAASPSQTKLLVGLAHQQDRVHPPHTPPTVLIQPSPTCPSQSKEAKRQNHWSIGPNSTNWRTKRRSCGRSSTREKLGNGRVCTIGRGCSARRRWRRIGVSWLRRLCGMCLARRRERRLFSVGFFSRSCGGVEGSGVDGATCESGGAGSIAS